MNCRDFEKYAIEHLDGKLHGKTLADVEQHLESCPACAERWRGFCRVSGLLETWEAVQPSASFDSRLGQRILSEGAIAGRWWERPWLRGWLVPVGKPALAGAVFGLMLFAVIVTRYFPDSAGVFPRGDSATLSTAADGTDELVLYQDLPVLEDLDLLANFEVLQELKTTTP